MLLSRDSVKPDIFRLTHPKWHLYRSVFLRDKGCTWKKIADELDRKVSTVKGYYRRGKKELEFEDTLWFYLPTSARYWLATNGVDSKSRFAPETAGYAVCSYESTPGLGPVIRRDILNAIDDFYEARAYRRQAP